MRLQTEFYKLPLIFDIERLVEEISVFTESDWVPHPMKYKGNLSIPLISVNGEYNDSFIGPMAMTPALKRCCYIQQVLASFKSVFGRSRLMRLDGGSEVPAHGDINYHWYSRVRIHIPIITDPAVGFFCNKKRVHMAPGEAWIFDSWKVHRVVNPADRPRIHLVVDTAGSADFWDLVEQSERPLAEDERRPYQEPRFVDFKRGVYPDLHFEKYNGHVVMSPGELDALALDLLADLQANPEMEHAAVERFARAVNRFRHGWRCVWLRFGMESAGWPVYGALIRQLLVSLGPNKGELLLSSNRAEAVEVLHSRILSAAFNPELGKL